MNRLLTNKCTAEFSPNPNHNSPRCHPRLFCYAANGGHATTTGGGIGSRNRHHPGAVRPGRRTAVG